MAFSYEGATKAFTKYLCAGFIAVFPIQAYYKYVDGPIRNKEQLTFYEYRRKLLNCEKSYNGDHTNCAKHYLWRCTEADYSERDRYFSIESHEQHTIPRVELEDAYLKFDNWLLSGIASLGIGWLAYSRIYGKHLVKCPPQTLQFVYWKGLGVNFSKRLFGKYKNINFIHNGRIFGSESAFCLPFFQKVGFVNLAPYKVDMVKQFPLNDGKHVTIKADLTLQMQELEEDPEIFYNATRLMNLPSEQCSERSKALIEFALNKICSQVSTSDIAADKELFYIYIQQRIGQALLNLGVRVIRCDIIGYECEPQKEIGFVGGNINNSYFRKCKMWVSWVFRFMFSIGRISWDWKQWKKP